MHNALPLINEQHAPTLLRYQKRGRLEVILKITERCNIDCTYCYFFHGEDQSFRWHPTSMAMETIDAIGAFLREGVNALALNEVMISLHGGEPLLLGKARFASLCERLSNALTPVTNLIFCIQTNAMLIDQGWIDLFEKYHVLIGVSMDGPAEYHDAARVDFKGRGTYQRVVRGVQLLHLAAAQGRIEKPGVLCVINPTYSAAKIYRHFVDDMGFEAIDFLLPHETHDSFSPGENPESYGRYLCEIFDLWKEDDNPALHVRVLVSIFSLLLGGPSLVSGYGTQLSTVIVIGSDGSLGPEDSLRACGEHISQSGMHIQSTTLQQYLKSTLVTKLENAYYDLHETCLHCCWANVCGGGALVNRYSKATDFKNPSVFCAGLKLIYAHVATHLLAQGLPIAELQEALLVVR